MTRAELALLIRPERRRIALSGVAAVVQGVLLYPALWLVRELFDVVIPQGMGREALLLCAGILAVRLVAAEAGLVQRTLAMRAAKGAAANRRQELMDWLLGADIAQIERSDPAVIQSRLVHETERLDVMLNRALSVAGPSLVTSVLAIGAMTVIDWRLAILALALGVPASWVAARGGEVATQATRSFQGAYERYTSSARFAVRHVLLVRSRGHVDDERAAQDKAIESLRDRGVSMAVAFARQSRRQTFAVTTVAIAVLALGSILVIEGDLTVGELAAFYVSALVCGNAVSLIGGSIPDIKGGLVAAERLSDLVTGAQQAHRGAGITESILPLRLDNVGFSYGDRPVFTRVTLEIAASRHIDLGGANGAGKSTLVRLVLGLERATTGIVTAGGHPIEELNGELLRRRIGYAPQKPTFFNGSVIDNLLYGRPGADRREAESAAALAGIEERILELEGGFDAPLGEDGAGLSGGEGQRLAIARALIGDPELVILDEPGNHLPSGAVAEIIGRIRTANPDLAILTIGHNHLAPGIPDLSVRLHRGHLNTVRADD